MGHLLFAVLWPSSLHLIAKQRQPHGQDLTAEHKEGDQSDERGFHVRLQDSDEPVRRVKSLRLGEAGIDSTRMSRRCSTHLVSVVTGSKAFAPSYYNSIFDFWKSPVKRPVPSSS